MSKRILLVDDHKILRDGLRSLLETEMGNIVVGEAEDGATAIKLARKLKPEVIIMDLSMPDMNGIEATKQISLHTPSVKIIALSMHSDKRFVIDMFRAGASGYLLKDCAFEELEMAINAVTSNHKYVSPNLTDVVLDDYVDRLKYSTSTIRSLLSERELVVLIGIVDSKTTRQIAEEMKVSKKTVDTYRQRVFQKLNVLTIPELVKHAIREGITTCDK